MATTTKKERTHERIVESAARAIRREGYAGVSVADIMKDAGLTHGGFYAHFTSRDALLFEALSHAGNETLANLERAEGEGADLDALVDAYLSERHVKGADSGCVLAALGSETRRQSPELRGLATRSVRGMSSLITKRLIASGRATEADAGEQALGVVATLVGALILARAVDRPEVSRAVRSAARRAVLGSRSKP